ncbi:hypothetical protein SGFS_091560 [Streptomyces graminofaciens]|uniref:Uncharacterized protein n=1 Tax=Streptomyces graminofaciens TaxID=68212 RepID=A0ABN5W0Z9_9ACTN|nr:hypothetical protein SGFS_091560 [Streptomyces graminofaciens]
MLDLLFEDKVVLVTGGASGIGEACAIAFGDLGTAVIGAHLDSGPRPCRERHPEFGASLLKEIGQGCGAGRRHLSLHQVTYAPRPHLLNHCGLVFALFADTHCAGATESRLKE